MSNTMQLATEVDMVVAKDREVSEVDSLPVSWLFITEEEVSHPDHAAVAPIIILVVAVIVGPVVPEAHRPHQTYNFFPPVTATGLPVIAVHGVTLPSAVKEAVPVLSVATTRITMSLADIPAGKAGVMLNG